MHIISNFAVKIIETIVMEIFSSNVMSHTNNSYSNWDEIFAQRAESRENIYPLLVIAQERYMPTSVLLCGKGVIILPFHFSCMIKI